MALTTLRTPAILWAKPMPAFLLILFITVPLGAEVIGVFQTLSGRQGIVTAPTRSGFDSVEILLEPEGKRERLSLSSGWSLEDDRIAARAAAPGKGPTISVRAAKGFFHLPAFAGTYMLNAGEKAQVHFEDAQGRRKPISLPIRGGEIRAFRVMPEGLELLVYDQPSISEIKEKGRRLFGVSRHGENVLIRVTPRGAGRAKQIGSRDSQIYWADKRGLFRVDEAALRLIPR